MTVVSVVGGTGFIGSSCVEEFGRSGNHVLKIRAPRLSCDLVGASSSAIPKSLPIVTQLARQFEGSDVVVNAAGSPLATAGALTSNLIGANVMLPRVVAAACELVGVARLVHVSSAAVQGKRVLDESDAMEPFSAYSRSKALGEQMLRRDRGDALQITCFRPTSVHGPTRQVSRTLCRIARSPLSSVAGRGEGPTPQVLVENTASAIAFCATSTSAPPPIVLQPSEGQTCVSLLKLLGLGKAPVQVPKLLASTLVRSAKRVPLFDGQVRRLEMLWFGQAQTDGWLTKERWRPPVDYTGWELLASRMS